MNGSKWLIIGVFVLVIVLLLTKTEPQTESVLIESRGAETAPNQHAVYRRPRPPVGDRVLTARVPDTVPASLLSEGISLESSPTAAAAAPTAASVPAETPQPSPTKVVDVELTAAPLSIPGQDTAGKKMSEDWSETITVPQAAIPELSRWELSLAPSIATGMLDGLEYLIDYPFG